MDVLSWTGKSDRELKQILSNDGEILTSCDSVRFPSLMYTAHGKDTIERLWQETLNEFDFVGIRGILEAMKGN
jgi:hypothetical protein